MTGSDFFTSADPLLSANNSTLFAITTALNNGPPSPPWDEGDLDGLDDLVEAKDVDEFLSLSPESLRLDSETEEVITNFLTSSVPEDLDLDDLSTSSSDEVTVASTLNFSDLVYGTLASIEDNSDKNNNESAVLMPVTSEIVKSTTESNIGYCSVCTLVFASASLLDKHKKEFEDRISCCHCKKHFNTLSKLRTHHRKHSKEKPFKCQICGKYYTHRNTLARHQLLSCKPLKVKTEEEDVSTSKQPHNSASDHLTKMILEAEVVLQDQKVPAKRKSDLPTSSSQPASKVSKTTTPSVDATKCLVCDKEFFDTASLDNHKSYHLNNRECCRCHKVLGNKSKLLTHHRSHTKELPYHCSLCAKSFAELSTLRKHEATHGERNFRCDICTKAFVRKDYLAKHSLTHRQTFKCSQCSYVCHNKGDIEKHVTSMHS